MNDHRLTLVTITKDDPAGLARTLASAAALRAGGAEQVVVDGSAAGKALTGETGGGDATLRHIPRPARGIADAFNAGIAAARGEWIWFLNGGDSVDPGAKPHVLFDLLERTQADVVIGGLTYAGEVAPRVHPPGDLRWPPVRSWIPHPATLVRRRMFERFGGFDERYTIAMDYEWWLRAIPRGEGVDVLSTSLAVFAPGGLSQRPEMQPTIALEQRHAVRRHLGPLMRSWAALSARAWRLWGRAWVARRGPSP